MPPYENPVIAMFAWWNAAYVADGFTAEGFGRFFAPELEFTVNGNLRGRNPAELAAAFRRIRAATKAVRLCLPVVETFRADDKVFVHYRVEASDDAGDSVEEAFAYARIADGLIARMIVISRETPASA
jgi:hypothetical protein